MMSFLDIETIDQCQCPFCVQDREAAIRARAKQKDAEIAAAKAKAKAMTTSLTFERALAFLRDGKPVRRALWHRDSHIFAVKGDVFVVLPPLFIGKNMPPQNWKPYPNDVLSTDWQLA